MFKKLLFFTFALLNSAPIWAYYKTGQIWQDKGITYILFGEIHKTKNPLNKVAIHQMHDVISWAQRLNAHVILEGGTLINNKEYIANPFNYQNKRYNPAIPTLLSLSNESALVDFDSLCHLAGISVNNIECRIGYGNTSSKANEFYNHLMKMLNHIKSFQDTDAANRIYTQEINKFEELQRNMPQIFSLMQHEDKLSFDEFLNKYNKYTSEYCEPTHLDQINPEKMTVQELSALEDKIHIKDPIQRELNLLFRYFQSYSKNTQISTKLDDIDLLSRMFAKELKISFEARLFDPIVLHASLNTNHRVKIICVGDAHREWLSDRFQELNFTKIAECSSPNESQININQFLNAQFPQESTLHVPSNSAQRVLALGKTLDKYRLINNASSPFICGAIPPILAAVPAMLTGYIVGKLTPQTIKIGNREIPLRLITDLGISVVSLAAGTYAGYKYLIAPQPVKNK